MKPLLFLDLDGVLADFFGYYETCFGVKAAPDDDTPNFWDNIRNHGRFYLDQPLMHDALELWHGASIFAEPTILTGIPYSIPNVAAHKRLWVDKHFGRKVRLITCPSREKKLYGRAGDILVDDRVKYSHYWTEMGGVFVLHTSARDTLGQLAKCYAMAR